MSRRRDRQETTEELDMAMVLLHRLRARLSTIPDTVPGPWRGSILHEERQFTAREPIDTLVVANRARARDCLDRLFDLMIDDENSRVVASPYAGYALIRTAIESAAVSLWLIQSARRSDRVIRALQLSYRNTLEGLSLARLIGSADVIAAEEARVGRTLVRLRELKNSVGQLRQAELGNPPKYTEILKSVSRQPGRPREEFEFSSPVAVWKMSSSFIHGSEQVVRMLSDLRQLEDFDEGMASFELTPKLGLLAMSAAECVQLLLRVDDRYSYLCSHDYGGRKVATPTSGTEAGPENSSLK